MNRFFENLEILLPRVDQISHLVGLLHLLPGDDWLLAVTGAFYVGCMNLLYCSGQQP